MKKIYLTMVKYETLKGRGCSLLLLLLFLCYSSLSYAQQTITGKITDNAGAPVIGASIVIKNTTTGTITDYNGNYSLGNVSPDNILVFSYVGMKTVEILVSAQTLMDVIMEEETIGLEEVVVVGYGTQRKESVVGSISHATGDELRRNVQGSDLANALTGQIPGLVSLQQFGIPGGVDEQMTGGTGRTEFLIRGQTTWNEAGPLILVDGVERSLHDINPYEVERISVLKDASATAVFGVKGANGVILITTLRGQEGKPYVSVNASVTGKTVSRIQHNLRSYEANQMRNHACLNEVSVMPTSWLTVVPQEYLKYWRDKTYPEYFVDVDWFDEMLRDYSVDKNVNVTASGGTSFVKYFTSFSYLNEGDIMRTLDYGQEVVPSYGFDRLNFRSNLDFDITPTTRFSTNLAGYYAIRQRMVGGENLWQGLAGTPPDLFPPIYSDGVWADYAGYDRYSNPLMSASLGTTRISKETNINTDFQLTQKMDFITEGLSAKAKLSYDNTSGTSGPVYTGVVPPVKWINPNIVEAITPGMTQAEIKELEKAYTVWEFRTVPGGGYDYFDIPMGFNTESAQSGVYRSLYYEFSLNYARDFENHSIGGLLLMSRNETATGSGFTSYREDWVGRVTYNFDRRYLFELNAAYNGSEKFSRDYRFGFFPSFAVGWLASNEPFFERITSSGVVNNFKVRYSDGRVGSDAGIPRWLYTGSWSVTNAAMPFGYPIPQPAFPATFEGIIPNPGIQWEEAHKRNIGIETGFFKNLLTVNFDYFWEDRTNIFVSGDERIMPAYFGADPVAANIGEVKSNGWEIESKLSKTTGRGLNLWVGLAWSCAIDEIIEKGDPELSPDYQKRAGYQIEQTRGRLNQPNGLINSWNDMYTGVVSESNVYALPGDFKIVDFNSDGVINADDAVPYGYPSRPQYTYSPRMGFSYKNLSGNIVFYGMYNLRGEGLSGGFREATYNRVWPENRDSWSPERGVTTDAKFVGLRFNTASSSGAFWHSRAHLKIQSAELAYSLPSASLASVGIKNLTFRASANNFIIWGDLQEDLVIPRGDTKTNYPLLSRVTFGMSFNF